MADTGDLRTRATQVAVEESAPGGVIQVRLRTLAQLFNSIDPSPFHDRDIDPEAEEWIVSSAKEVDADALLCLIVHLEETKARPGEDNMVQRAVHAHFQRKAELSRRELRQLFGRGRKSLVIGLTAVALAVLAGNLAHSAMGASQLADVVREGFLIGGWVAMWRPLEIFLYAWWPIRADRRVFERLAAMKVVLKRCGWRCEHDLALE